MERKQENRLQKPTLMIGTPRIASCERNRSCFTARSSTNAKAPHCIDNSPTLQEASPSESGSSNETLLQHILDDSRRRRKLLKRILQFPQEELGRVGLFGLLADWPMQVGVGFQQAMAVSILPYPRLLDQARIAIVQNANLIAPNSLTRQLPATVLRGALSH